ncbi:transposase, partial [Bacillus sp. SS-TM]
MKNHVIANGQILQMNKKWSNLKQNQQNMITEWLQAEYQRFIEVHLRKPKKKELGIVAEQPEYKAYYPVAKVGSEVY